MTQQPKSLITPDNDSVTTEIEIAAPPDRVFQALVNRDQALQWGMNDTFEIILWEIDLRVGGAWHFISKERSGKNPPGLDRYEHHGEYLEIDPPRLLVQTWHANWHSNPGHTTIVRWELMATKKGTLLKVTHSGLAPLADAAQGYSQGWPGLIEQIKNFVENLPSK
jgi:uncharacterized protein YndB with AHSA1/START domain